MQAQFWHDRWQLNEIGFHQAQVHPLLIEYWPNLAVTEGQVFVPLCGKTLDMVWLRQQGHSVLGVELSPLAVKDFFSEQSLSYVQQSAEGFQHYQSEGIELLCGDFFELKPEYLGQVKAIYDRAALIALPQELQVRYAEYLLALLPHRPPILLITFEYQQSQMDGPPFSTSEDRVRDLFGQAYQIEILTERDILDEVPGLKSRGLTRLTEKAYRLTSPAA